MVPFDSNATGSDAALASATLLKVAKKALKKHDSPQMKMKLMVKAINKKLEESMDKSEIQKFLSESDLFTVEGKLVSLRDKKRKRSGEGEESEKKSAKTSGPVSVPDWRKEHKVILKPASETDPKESAKLNEDESYHPYTSFSSAGCADNFSPSLLRHCTVTKGFATPTPIQCQSWPVLLHPSKRDLVGIAETGSGKTLAFSLPALSSMEKTVQKHKKRLPQMLTLAPTRELAMQSHEVLSEFGKVVGLTSLVIYGGVPKFSQTVPLKKGFVDCIVATPGRLKDLIQDNLVDLSRVCNLVLDEADRMLDMGFEEDVRFIISQCMSKDKRQTCMFSATWPACIKKLAMEYMTDPLRVYVGFESICDNEGGEVDDSLSANKRVTQTVEVIEDRSREGRLRQLLKQYHVNNNRILIFALYKKEAARIERNLYSDGYNCCSIHGDKNQADRTKALMEFKSGKVPLLIATDVAARGLDIPNVEVVINFTFPLTIEDYVHRIGRTGRAGKTGKSITFFQSGDKAQAGSLQAVMRKAGQDVPEDLMKFGSTIKKKEHKLYGNFGPKDGIVKKAVKITFDY